MKDRANAFVTMSGDGKRSHVRMFTTNTPPPAAKPKAKATPCRCGTCAENRRRREARNADIRNRARADLDRDLAAMRAEAAFEARLRKVDFVEPILGRP